MRDKKADDRIDNVWSQPFVLLKLPAGKFHDAGSLESVCTKFNALHLSGVSFFVNREELGIDLKIEHWATFDPWNFVINALFLDRQLDKSINAPNKFEALSEAGLRYDQKMPDIPFSKYYHDPNKKAYWDVVRSILGNEELIRCLSEDTLTKEKISDFLNLSRQQCKAFQAKRKDWLLY